MEIPFWRTRISITLPYRTPISIKLASLMPTSIYLKRSGRKILALLFGLLLTGCSQSQAMWQVMVGNYRYEQGRYTQATTNYFSALQQEYEIDVIQYNLGVLYHAQGEVEAAQSKWELVDATAPDLLRAKAHYNRGVVLYQLGEYKQAIAQFRKALLLNSQDRAAKINMEIAQNAQHRKENRDENANEAPPLSQQNQRQLDYLKRRSTIFLNIETQDDTWIDPDDI
ncbi:tetratricopeptide repeat protein [Entomospira culicis]|uniref:Tetratricopeptide repeat protein n=1 Tax=Entomospira culicis TaxID=2719989 RepID=A0A968GE93_9SPIO|nr:tetratricopeptide repeat protein [Entomospira culicis]NIZ18719.1 tetratricopeptide repeat protein [Entomospira culicis]NIZ68934.1 tetratricopeptide repeat protein [Entomospira culicis]WDI37527.1 tetratricopeptide repeat protein [Entomospira culicis]WDI39155.1 tetratricopeptide repeat protein [Entomospira culicis]